MLSGRAAITSPVIAPARAREQPQLSGLRRPGGYVMTSLDCSPLNEIVGGLLLLISAMSAAHGTRRLMRGLRHARPLDVVHGIRGSVVAVAAATFAGSVLLAQTCLMVLGAAFLGGDQDEPELLADSA